MKVRYCAQKRGYGASVVIDRGRNGLTLCWCGDSGVTGEGGTFRSSGLREAKRIAAALNTALREKVRRKKERERRMNRSGPVRGDRRVHRVRFPERWRAKKPTRIFGVLNTKTGRLHTFASVEAARRHLERHGGLRMQLRRDRCVNAGRRGWLTRWFRGPPQWPKEVRWFRGAR